MPETETAAELMRRFAERTGLTSARPPERYLWTDAFAVCNLLGLGLTELALRLIDQVHHTLGQHRADDSRSGWISGLAGEVAEAYPTRGGLRIGKRLPERMAADPLDEQTEWEQDGQYFHYLTRWMHALDQAARWTREPTLNRWARELAEVAHRAFAQSGRGGGMAWKMSIDLSRPLVASMGHHDALDGYLTCVQLDWSASRLGAAEGPSLRQQATHFARMMPADLSTSDPLGIGGLLVDAWRTQQLTRAGAISDSTLLDQLLDAARAGLSEYQRSAELRATPSWRLAFRELGLSIGLAVVPHLPAGDLARFLPLRAEIESLWLRPEQQSSPSWLELRNINEVMLATSLAPAGYLTLVPESDA